MDSLGRLRPRADFAQSLNTFNFVRSRGRGPSLADPGLGFPVIVSLDLFLVFLHSIERLLQHVNSRLDRDPLVLPQVHSLLTVTRQVQLLPDVRLIIRHQAQEPLLVELRLHLLLDPLLSGLRLRRCLLQVFAVER